MKTIRRAEGGASGEMKNTKVLKEDKKSPKRQVQIAHEQNKYFPKYRDG